MGAVLTAMALVALAIGASHQLARVPIGHIVLLMVAVVVPVLVSAGGLVMGVKRSSSTEFCASCHEMTAYGQSLFVDNPDSLAAVHYQKRLISRDQTCFACHTDYAMFGDAKAKMNGLKHVWVHYTGGPEKIELYQPYPNHNCLHCHDDARAFLEVPVHQEHTVELHEGKRSCLSCHDVGHDLEGVKEGRFWQAEAAR